MEVVIGNDIAQKLSLKIGDEFFGSHGDAAEGEVHDHYAYKIVGIAKPTGKVVDNLIFVRFQVYGKCTAMKKPKIQRMEKKVTFIEGEDITRKQT